MDAVDVSSCDSDFSSCDTRTNVTLARCNKRTSEEEDVDVARFKKRALEADDEAGEFFAALYGYMDHVNRVRSACSMTCSIVDAAVAAYVKYRGGIQEIRLHVVPPNVSFDADSIDEKWFVQHFRFSHAQMNRVVVSLMQAGIPAVIKTASRDKCGLHEALCMLCFKYAWPTRLGTMVKLFGASTSRLSRLTGQLRRLLHARFIHKLQHPNLLTAEELTTFCAAVEAKSGLSICFGFIDGTVRPIAKPSVLQGACYNGKDRVHALKYQALVLPNGMFHQLCGPWPGSRHDMFLLHKSELVNHIVQFPRSPQGAVYCAYADQGYSEQAGISTPYFDGAVNAVHEAYNQAMSSSRIAVEWAFGDILVLWASLALKSQQQLLSQRKIGQVYLVAGLLTNMFNTVQPGNASKYFKVRPPSLEAYMASMMS